MARIAYFTDAEGRWDKLESFLDRNPLVRLDQQGALELADQALLVFGGDLLDRGSHSRRLVALLLAARRRYPDRVVLLAGNRDINKVRLIRELAGRPPQRAPAELGPDAARPELLRWIFRRTMNAADAFAHRQTELADTGEDSSDDGVVQSFLDDLAPTGLLTEYLCACQLAFQAEETIFVHGGVTTENLGQVPGAAHRFDDVAEWIAELNRFYQRQIALFADPERRKDDPEIPPWQAIVDYQAPLRDTGKNQGSVVYGRPADDDLNPLLPPVAVVERLRQAGIHRVVVGHTPSGDCPALLRDGEGFEQLLADNSYGRIEVGAQVLIDRERLFIRGATLLDSGERASVELEVLRSDDALLGKRDPLGRLVKSRLQGGYLLFRALGQRRVEQAIASADELSGSPLVPPR